MEENVLLVFRVAACVRNSHIGQRVVVGHVDNLAFDHSFSFRKQPDKPDFQVFQRHVLIRLPPDGA